MSLVAWLGSVVVLEIGNNEGTKIGFWDGKVIGTILGSIDRLSLDTYDGTYLGSTDGTVYEKFDVLLLGASFWCLYGLYVGCTEGTELFIFNGRVFVTTIGTYDGR